jgi:uncharacterized membrane protein YGL010W
MSRKTKDYALITILLGIALAMMPDNFTRFCILATLAFFTLGWIFQNILAGDLWYHGMD